MNPMDVLADSLRNEDLPAILAAIHGRQECQRLSASKPVCCTRQAVIAVDPDPGVKHYKKAICGSCGKFFGWISKPKNLAHRAPSTTSIRPSSCCAICLTETALEVHHIIEIQDGGDNAPDNRMTLCRGCHALVHWVRHYRMAT